MKIKALAFWWILDAVFSGHHTIEILLDEQKNFLVQDNHRTVFKADSLAACQKFIADRFYYYGYAFDVHGMPGETWANSMFKTKKLNPNDYIFGGVK